MKMLERSSIEYAVHPRQDQDEIRVNGVVLSFTNEGAFIGVGVTEKVS